MTEEVKGLSDALGEIEGNDEQIKQPEAPVSEQPTKIKVGDNEYDQETLNRLVGLGQETEKYSKEFNTPIDKVWPAYGKSQNELRELKQKYADATTPKLPENEEQAVKEAQVAARKLGILTKDDLSEMGILTKESAKEWYKEQREAERIVEQAKSMEKELDGKDGRPAFDAVKVLTYANDNGIPNLETAYKLMHEPQLDAWKEAQLAKGKKPGMATISANNVKKEPAPVRVTKENLDALMREALEG